MNFSETYSSSTSFFFDSDFVSYQTLTDTVGIDYDVEIQELQEEMQNTVLPEDFEICTDNSSDFLPPKKGSVPHNFEYIEGIDIQNHKLGTEDVFDYNDVISYFESKGENNNE